MPSVDLASITSSTTASLDYAGYLINANSGQVILTLPDMTGMGDGASLILVRTDLNQNVNVIIMPTNTTIGTTSAPFITIPILTSYTIVYNNGVWNLTEANDALLTNNYKFDFNFYNGNLIVYSAFEDLMDLITITNYQDEAVIAKLNQQQQT